MATERIQIIITESGSLRVRRNIDDIGGSANRSSSSLNTLKKSLAGIAAALSVQKLVQWADAWTSASGQIKLATASAAEHVAVTNELFRAAQTTASSFSSMVEMYARTARAGKELGASQNQIIQFTENVGKSLGVQGVSAQDASGALLQLGQAMGGGTVRAEEFNSILESAPYILQIVANNIDAAGGSIGQLRALMVDGKLSSREFFEAFLAGSEQIDQDFSKMSMTFGQGFTVLTNSMTQLIGKLNESSTFGDKFAKAMVAISGGLDWLGRNADTVAGTIGGLIATLATLKLGLLASAWVSYANGATLASYAVLKVRAALLLVSAHPLVAAATAMVALASAVAVYGDRINAGIDETTSLKDVMRAMGEVGQEVWAELGEFTDRALTGMSNDVQTFYNWATKTTETSSGRWNKAYAGFFDDTGTGFSALARSIARTLDAIGGLLTGLAIAMGKTFAGLPIWVAEAAKEAYNRLVSWVEKGVNAMITAVNDVQPFDFLKKSLITIPKASTVRTVYGNFGADIAASIHEGFAQQGGAMENMVIGLFSRASRIGKERLAAEMEQGGAVDLSQPLGGMPSAQESAKQLKDATDALKKTKTAAKELKDELKAPWLRGTVEFKDEIMAASKRFNVDHRLVQAIIRQETGWMKNAAAQLKAVSPAGAQGIMQLMPDTAKAVAKEIGMTKYNIWEAADNITLGVAYLSKQLAAFNNDPALAAAAYNAGPNRKSLQEGRIPNIKETQGYVKNVIANYKELVKNSDTTSATLIENMVKEDEQRKKLVEVYADLDFAIAQQEKALALTNEQRTIDNQTAQIQQQLAKQGINLTEDETQLLLEKITTLQSYEKKLKDLEQLEQKRLEYGQYLLGLDRDLAAAQSALANVSGEREVMNEVMRVTHELSRAGLILSEAETEELENKLTAIHAYNKAVEQQTTVLQAAIEKRKGFADQLVAIRELLDNPNSGFTKTDAADAVMAATGDLLAGTTMAAEQELKVFEDKYQKIKDLRTLDLISERTAQEARLLLLDAQKRKMVELEVQAARTRLALGFGDIDDMGLVALSRLTEGFTNFATGATDIMGNFFSTFADGFANSIGRAIVYSEDLGEALRGVAKQAVASLISAFVKLGIQWLVNAAIGKSIQASQTAASVAAASTTAAAWAPAAAMVSLATMGANAAPAAGGILLTTGMSSAIAATAGGLQGFERGGYTGDIGRKQIAGVVHGREFVVNAAATAANRPALEAMNAGVSPNTGGGTVNVKIENYGTSKDFEVQQLSATEVRIIARDEAKRVVATDAPNHVATAITQPNSRVSKALQGSTNVERRRN